MYIHGASLELIALHLEVNYKQAVTHSTILRYLHSIGLYLMNKNLPMIY